MSNKEIIKMCPNFYKIVNFTPVEKDGITDKMINIYQNFIFDKSITPDDFDTIKQIDHILGKYIDDFNFRKEFQKKVVKIKIDHSDKKKILRNFIYSVIKLYEDYEEYTTKVIYISRWI